MKTAIITGITGQDGAYLAQVLLEKEYRVIGLLRSYNSKNIYKLEYLNIKKDIILEECDLTDFSNIFQIINTYHPDEIYNLAAQSSVSLSFKQPISTLSFNIISVANLLEAIRYCNKNIKFYQASSSEMYGNVKSLPITESTPFHPVSPYAVSKASAHWNVINYRESYNMFACCGILFNHESFLRSNNFFVKKIIQEAIEIKNGWKDNLLVGNIKIKRDFGYSPDYVEAMWMMLQMENPDDYMICTGHSISLEKIIEYVLNIFDIPLQKIKIDKSLFRPNEIADIYGDNSKAKKILGWNRTRPIEEILNLIVYEELSNYKK